MQSKKTLRIMMDGTFNIMWDDKMKKCNVNQFRTKAFEDGVIYPQPIFIDSCRDCGWFRADDFQWLWSSGICTYNEKDPQPIKSVIIPEFCPLEDVDIGDISNTIGVIGVIGLCTIFFVIGIIAALLVFGIIA